MSIQFDAGSCKCWRAGDLLSDFPQGNPWGTESQVSPGNQDNFLLYSSTWQAEIETSHFRH